MDSRTSFISTFIALVLIILGMKLQIIFSSLLGRKFELWYENLFFEITNVSYANKDKFTVESRTVGIIMKNLLEWKEDMNQSIRKQLNSLELILLCTVLMVHTVFGDHQVYR